MLLKDKQLLKRSDKDNFLRKWNFRKPIDNVKITNIIDPIIIDLLGLVAFKTG